MGVLTNYQKQQPIIEPQLEETPTDKSVSRPTTVESPTDPPLPCLICESPYFWKSPYDDELRCAICSPWPTLALVGSRWMVAIGPDGSMVWEPFTRSPAEREKYQTTMADPDSDGWRMFERTDRLGEWSGIERMEVIT